jgi:hypothetical protein
VALHENLRDEQSSSNHGRDRLNEMKLMPIDVDKDEETNRAAATTGMIG